MPKTFSLRLLSSVSPFRPTLSPGRYLTDLDVLVSRTHVALHVVSNRDLVRGAAIVGYVNFLL